MRSGAEFEIDFCVYLGIMIHWYTWLTMQSFW